MKDEKGAANAKATIGDDVRSAQEQSRHAERWRSLTGGGGDDDVGVGDGDADGDTLVLNVGGALFETRRSTLLAVPDSRLAAVATLGRLHEAYRPRRGDFYFDRHPGAFDAVLQYHRSGELHARAGLCGRVLKTEFDYWGINYLKVEQCCWDEFNSKLNAASDFSKLDRLFADVDHPDSATIAAMPPCRRYFTVAWLTLEAPSYSRLAKVYLSITTFFTLASVAVFLAESHSSLTESYCCYLTNHSDPSETLFTLSDLFPCDSARVASLDNSSIAVVREDYVPGLRYTDLTVYSFFLFDFLLRASLSQRRKQFFTSPANMVDFVCIVSQTIAISERYVVNSAHIHEASNVLTSSTQWVRTFRLLRIFKLLRHSVMVKVLAYTIITAFRELVVVLLVLLTFVTLFGSVAYYVEPVTFPTITYGCWWALVTLTTIGYGDVTPKTTGGYVVGTLCALCGVFSVAFTVPIVVSNFNMYYSHAQSHKARASHVEAAAASQNEAGQKQPFSGGVELKSYAALHEGSGPDRDRLRKHNWTSSVAPGEQVDGCEAACPQTVIDVANGKHSAGGRQLGVVAGRQEYDASRCNYGFVSSDGDLCQGSTQLNNGEDEKAGGIARFAE